MDDFIAELRALRKQKNIIQSKESKLCDAQLDIERLEDIYKIVPDRDTFLMVCIRVFSPRAFVGDRLKHNIRAKLANILCIQKEYVSTLIKVVIFRYDKVSRFKRNVNEAYDKVKEIFNL